MASKTYSVVLTEGAEQDLESIYDCIAESDSVLAVMLPALVVATAEIRALVHAFTTDRRREFLHCHKYLHSF